MSKGWRKDYPDVVAAILGTIADAGYPTIKGQTTGAIIDASGTGVLTIVDQDNCSVVKIETAAVAKLDSILLPAAKTVVGDILTVVNATASDIAIGSYDATLNTGDYAEVSSADAAFPATLILAGNGYGIATFKYSTLWGGSERTWLYVGGNAATGVPASRTIGTTAPLAGGGDLSADRTLSITAADASNPGSMSAADFSKLAGLPSTAPPTSRLINTTAPLAGGGDLSADRTLSITAATALAAGSMSAADFQVVHSLLSAFSGRPLIGTFSTPEMDFAAAPGTTWTFDMPTAPAGFGYLPIATSRVFVTARDGTVTTGCTVKIGNNATHDNLYTGLAAAPGTTTVKNGSIAHLSATTQATPDGSLGPYVVEQVTAATLGTATTYKGRFMFFMILVQLAP